MIPQLYSRWYCDTTAAAGDIAITCLSCWSDGEYSHDSYVGGGNASQHVFVCRM